MRIAIVGAGAIGCVVGGMLTPFNEAVVRLFATLGVGFKSDPRHLEPLVKMLPR